MGPKKKLLGIIASLVGALVGALVLPPSDGAMVGLPLSVGAVGAAVPLVVGAVVPLVVGAVVFGVGAVVPLGVGATVFGVGANVGDAATTLKALVFISFCQFDVAPLMLRTDQV